MDDSAAQGGSVATSVIEKLAFSLLAETFLFALYTILIAYLVCRPCTTRKAASLPSFMLPFTLSMFVLYLLYWTLDVYLLWAEFDSFLSPPPKNVEGPNIQNVHWKGASSINKDGLAPKYYATVYVQYIAQLTLIVLGDFVSLWRAFVIFGKQKWLYMLLIGIAGAESVTYVLIFTSSSTEYISSPVSGLVNALAEARTPLTFIGYSVSGLAQAASTSLIAYKAWVHWRDVREFMDRSTKRRSLTALAVIIESGIVYLGLLIWYGAINYWGAPDSLAVYTCRFYIVPLIAMYPTLVVVIVASRRSVLERSIVPKAQVMETAPPVEVNLPDSRERTYRARSTVRLTFISLDKEPVEGDGICDQGDKEDMRS
ncbi:unnamed protein product [Peniophora sp. CBMAI 1063]|nr:unnamed protein product [Peniophora sp. CBMAI 1063]